MRGVKLAAIFVLLGILLIGAHSVGNLNCSGHLRHDKELKINGKTIYVQAANTPESQQQGLSGKSCIAKNEGMLFHFDTPNYYQFWMKDMKFSIDIIWLDTQNQVVTVIPGVEPSTYPETFTNRVPAVNVIELTAGQAPALNIKVGDQVSVVLPHP